jgi:hypothetical protein
LKASYWRQEETIQAGYIGALVQKRQPSHDNKNQTTDRNLRSAHPTGALGGVSHTGEDWNGTTGSDVLSSEQSQLGSHECAVTGMLFADALPSGAILTPNSTSGYQWVLLNPVQGRNDGRVCWLLSTREPCASTPRRTARRAANRRRSPHFLDAQRGKCIPFCFMRDGGSDLSWRWSHNCRLRERSRDMKIYVYMGGDRVLRPSNRWISPFEMRNPYISMDPCRSLAANHPMDSPAWNLPII